MDELGLVLSKKDLDEAMKEMDTDGSGEVSPSLSNPPSLPRSLAPSLPPSLAHLSVSV